MRALLKCMFLVLIVMTGAVFASQARIESMGKHETFFMDEMSIFKNPANINIYPNFLIGELGTYTQAVDTVDYEALSTPEALALSAKYQSRQNNDPQNPWFGGIFSLSPGKDSETMYPQYTFGVFMNRKDEMEDYLWQAIGSQSLGYADTVVNGADTIDRVTPLTNDMTPVGGKIDGFLGYTTANGMMFGLHMYAVKQELIPAGENKDVRGSSIIKGDIGVNIPLSKGNDLEVGVGLANLGYTLPQSLEKVVNASGAKTYEETDLSYNLDLRLFSAMSRINGELVPVVGFKNISVRNYLSRVIKGGLGANVTMDRGFFWAGLEVQSNVTEDSTVSAGETSKKAVSVPVSFGIERNIFWDWFVIRVGGRRTISKYHEANGTSGWESNVEGDGTPADMVGWGVGLNIEERLKFDLTIAEDFPFTFGNLVSGQQHHLASRISASYSF